MMPLALEVRAKAGDETETIYVIPDEIASWCPDPPSAGEAAASSRVLFKHRAEARVCMGPRELFDAVSKALRE